MHLTVLLDCREKLTTEFEQEGEDGDEATKSVDICMFMYVYLCMCMCMCMFCVRRYAQVNVVYVCVRMYM